MPPALLVARELVGPIAVSTPACGSYLARRPAGYLLETAGEEQGVFVADLNRNRFDRQVAAL